MPAEPGVKRTVVFIDGQNLFYAVKHAFGYIYPNFDAICLAKSICEKQGWQLTQTRFYTGIPSSEDKPFWNSFWAAKLAVMGSRPAVHVFTRPLRYRNQTILLPDGQTDEFYLEKVKKIYKKELAAADVKDIKLQGKDQLCKRIERFFESQGLVFNKGSVAKEIRSTLSRMKSLDDLPKETQERAKKLIKAVTDAYPKGDD